MDRPNGGLLQPHRKMVVSNTFDIIFRLKEVIGTLLLSFLIWRVGQSRHESLDYALLIHTKTIKIICIGCHIFFSASPNTWPVEEDVGLSHTKHVYDVLNKEIKCVKIIMILTLWRLGYRYLIYPRHRYPNFNLPFITKLK